MHQKVQSDGTQCRLQLANANGSQIAGAGHANYDLAPQNDDHTSKNDFVHDASAAPSFAQTSMEKAPDISEQQLEILMATAIHEK